MARAGWLKPRGVTRGRWYAPTWGLNATRLHVPRLMRLWPRVSTSGRLDRALAEQLSSVRRMTLDTLWDDDGFVSDAQLAPSGHGPLDLSPLSEREHEILSAAVTGLAAREIAAKFTISEATVRSHLASIYAKVGVTGRVELLARINAGRPPDAGPGSEARDSVEPTPAHAATRPVSKLTGWLSGLVVGAASGFLALLAGPLGLVPALGFVPVAIRSRRRLASLAGLLVGAGAIALGMITAANASCTTVVTPTSYSSCTAPDLTGWVMLAGAAVVVGVSCSIAAIRRT
jgi:DNA-binding CsgD family transcriptional regulator